MTITGSNDADTPRVLPESPSVWDRRRWARRLRSLRLPEGWDVMVLLVAAAAVVLRSLWWPALGDVALMHHLGRLAAEGQVPYRDVFEMNLPGTWAVHGLGALLLGTSNLAVRLLDLAWLALTCWAGARVVAPFGRHAARVAVAALTIGYLAIGPYNTLQRDWLIVAPFLFAVDGWRRGGPLGRLQAGAALGSALLFRPQPILLLAFLVAVVAVDGPGPWTRRVRRSAEVAGGAAIPLALTTVVLAALGALGPFVRMWTEYVLPLYSQLGEDGRETSGPQSIDRTFNSMVRAMIDQVEVLLPLLLAVGALSALALHTTGVRRRTLLGLTVLVGYGGVHIVLSNRVWLYYWFPVVAACLALGATLWTSDRSSVRARAVRPIAMALLLALAARPYVLTHDRFPDAMNQTGTIDAAVEAIERVAVPGDRLQVFAVIGPASRIADGAGLDPCTGFVYDLHFFHHTDDPVVQDLRERFMGEFTDDRCRFVVTWKWSWTRADMESIAEFPEFHRLLREDYRTLYEDDRVVVFERERG